MALKVFRAGAVAVRRQGRDDRKSLEAILYLNSSALPLAARLTLSRVAAHVEFVLKPPPPC